MASLTAPTIDATGITAPTYTDVLAYIQTQYRAIYGNDVDLDNDTQDGQFIGVMALAISESNAAAIQIYQSFSPSTAQGGALTQNVKINGIRRNVPTNSTADVNVVGVAGTQIVNGIISDGFSQKWNLPALVTIPVSGVITVTATAQDVGAQEAGPGTMTGIVTPTRGWQSVTNPLAAVPGAPVESDFELRQRQKVSTALPSLSVFEGTIGAVANVAGVTRYKGYENDTNATNADGIPAHTISLVVEGGDVQAVADAIARHKTPGTGTYGTTTEMTFDKYGTPNPIKFFRPTIVPIVTEVRITPLAGYTSDYGNRIATAVVNAINALDIGDDVLFTSLYGPALLAGTEAEGTFNLLSVKIARKPGTPAAADLPMMINEAASAAVADVSVVIV